MHGRGLRPWLVEGWQQLPRSRRSHADAHGSDTFAPGEGAYLGMNTAVSCGLFAEKNNVSCPNVLTFRLLTMF